MFKRSLASACVLVPTIALLVFSAPTSAVRAATAADPATGPTIIPSVYNDVSVALTAMTDVDDKDKKDKKVKPHREIPGHAHTGASAAQPASAAVVAAAPALLNSFAGVGNGFSGPNGTFNVTSAPPDTNGAVGPNRPRRQLRGRSDLLALRRRNASIVLSASAPAVCCLGSALRACPQ